MKKENLEPFRVHITHLKYTVNEEERSVTARAQAYVDLPIYIYTVFKPGALEDGLSPYSAITVEHTSKCAPEDTFDVDTGYNLARVELQKKAYEKLGKILNGFLGSVQYLCSEIAMRVGQFNTTAENVEMEDNKYITELINGKKED